VKKLSQWWQNYFSEQDNMSSINIGNTKFYHLMDTYVVLTRQKLFAFGYLVLMGFFFNLYCKKLSVEFFFFGQTWHVTSKYSLKWRNIYRTYFPSACTSINTQYNTIVVRVTACWTSAGRSARQSEVLNFSKWYVFPLFAHLKASPLIWKEVFKCINSLGEFYLI